MRRKSFLLKGIIALYVLICLIVLSRQLALPPTETFADDAEGFNNAAINIVTSGFYSMDGEHAHLESEPVYPLFLAAIYFVFGVQNRAAIFVIQALLYLSAVLLLRSEFKRISSPLAADVLTAFLLLQPGVFHMIFQVMRESLVITLALIFSGVSLKLFRTPRWSLAILAGMLLGILVNAYIVFLFLPIFLLPILGLNRVPLKLWAPFVIAPLLLLSLWGYRNAQYGDLRVAFSTRSVWTWTMRATRVETMTAAEPLTCIWNEYITRDALTRKKCEQVSVVPGKQWPEGLPSYIDDISGLRALEREKKNVLLYHLPVYLAHSLAETIEYHLPYVNGWGFWYNILETLATTVLYAGCVLSLLSWRTLRQEYWLFAVIMIYSAGVFSLTNGLPRFHMPVLFCYAIFAALGYTFWLPKIFKFVKLNQARST